MTNYLFENHGVLILTLASMWVSHFLAHYLPILATALFKSTLDTNGRSCQGYYLPSSYILQNSTTMILSLRGIMLLTTGQRVRGLQDLYMDNKETQWSVKT